MRTLQKLLNTKTWKDNGMRAKTCRYKECNCPDCRLQRIEMAIDEIARMLADLKKADASGRKPRT